MNDICRKIFQYTLKVLSTKHITHRKSKKLKKNVQCFIPSKNIQNDPKSKSSKGTVEFMSRVLYILL